MVTSATQVTGLFGHPVAHSRSPQMHNAAFAALGLPYVYVAFDVAPEQVGAAVQSIRALGLRGVNVTIPHKVAVLPFLDELSPEAELIGAVNTIVNEGGRLIGYNTDGIGYLTALREETGFDVRGRRVLLIGAGGAARAVAAQIVLDGASQLTVAARSIEKAQELAQHLEQKAPRAALPTEHGSQPRSEQPRADAVDFSDVERVAAEYDLIINTTPIGMHPNVEAVPFATSCLRAGQLVSDLIYNPRETQLLREAEARGCQTSGGLGMFIHQGAHAFRLWTGHDAPTDVMRETVESCL